MLVDVQKVDSRKSAIHIQIATHPSIVRWENPIRTIYWSAALVSMNNEAIKLQKSRSEKCIDQQPAKATNGK
jgi:hypothetical protein